MRKLTENLDVIIKKDYIAEDINERFELLVEGDFDDGDDSDDFDDSDDGDMHEESKSKLKGVSKLKSSMKEIIHMTKEIDAAVDGGSLVEGIAPQLAMFGVVALEAAIGFMKANKFKPSCYKEYSRIKDLLLSEKIGALSSKCGE